MPLFVIMIPPLQGDDNDVWPACLPGLARHEGAQRKAFPCAVTHKNPFQCPCLTKKDELFSAAHLII